MTAALVGCVTPPTDRDRTIAAGPIECTGAEQCNALWARAATWIVQNSRWPVQSVTDTVITTATAPENETFLHYTATRIPQPGGGQHIRVQVRCPNPYGCGEHTISAAARFKAFVLSQ